MSDKFESRKGATIVDQRLSERDGKYSVVLTVSLPGNDSTKEPGEEVPVFLGFSGTGLELSYRALRHLGFADLDFTRLDPSSDKYFPLTGKKVDLYRKVDGKYWNISLPNKVDLNPAKQWVRDNQDMLREAATPKATPF